MSDSWTELHTLFHELVELVATERDARLEEIGARDGALRARLEAMLAADAGSTARLEAYADAVARSILAGVKPSSGVGERRDDPLGVVGTTVGHYRIEGLLGVGGMGVVYRATDVQLRREVALKFLPPALSLDSAAKVRFLNEARAASSLDHPNVCTIYEADETTGGTLYIAMACYQGETLRARLRRGPLYLQEALTMGVQVARGLAAAHGRGLVHRDVKPGNLFVTEEGTVKILDFGIAKAEDLGLTLPGQRPGTAAYMAPEQRRGEEVDGRADLWALGMVLFEAMTGTRPEGVGEPGVAVGPPSKDRPGVPSEVDALVLRMLAYDPADRPAGMEAVAAALERHREDVVVVRPAGMWDLAVADGPGEVEPAEPLHGGEPPGHLGSRRPNPVRSRVGVFAGIAALLAFVAAGAYLSLQNGPTGTLVPEAVAGEPRLLAVLPFVNGSPDAENEYFADGVTDDIRTHLARVPDLSVVSRTTTMAYKGAEASLPEIARELGVQYVLEGSVRRVGNEMRITAELVDGQGDRQLWAETYDRHLEDIFAVQTEIAQAIVEALHAELSHGVADRIARPPTGDLQAYDLFLAGRASFYRYDVQGIEEAVEAFREALDRDPAFTLARAWLSGTFAVYAFNVGAGAAWADSAVAHGYRAVEEQPDLSDAHTSLGTALLSAGRYEEGGTALERALELNPNEWAAVSNLGVVYAQRGHLDDAIRLTRRSLELEARASLPAYVNLAWYFLQLGLHDRAEAALRLGSALEPDHPFLVNNGAWLDVARGRTEEALRAAERLAAEAADVPRRGLSAAQLFAGLGYPERVLDAAEATYANSPTATGLYLVGVLYGYALGRAGRTERAWEVLDEAERYARERIEAGDEENVLRYSLACIHALRGERDAAFHWLDEAIRFGWSAAMVTASDPLLDDLRDDPRFRTALDRMEGGIAAMRERVEAEGW